MTKSEGDKDRKIKSVVIADDHMIVRSGLLQILERLDDVNVVAEADNGLAAIAAVKRYQPDLLVLDAAMPQAKGIEVLADCRRWSSSTAILLFTGFKSANILKDWLQADVEGILLKSSSGEEVEKSVLTILEGGRYVSQEAKDILDKTNLSVKLTNREREVLSMIATGQQNGEIAKRLFLSIRTVEKHRASLMAKLGVHSASELLVHALKEGLLDENKQL
ncbi:MAG: response regulator transcription factor [Sneathiellales bacterium]|nr:response regulator transcription factor [Sneathiellales bacterium]